MTAEEAKEYGVIDEGAERVGEKSAEVRKQLERNDQLPAVRSDIRKRKALEWLLDHVEIVDENGDPVDRSIYEPPAIDTTESTETAEAEAEAEDDTE